MIPEHCYSFHLINIPFDLKMKELLTLQTSQNFLLQKMLQKTLKICVIMPAFFELRNEGKT